MSKREIAKNNMKNELRDRRSKLQISQEEMAEKLDISVREYSDLENGKRFCSAFALINYVNNCDVDKDEFFSDFADIIDENKD